MSTAHSRNQGWRDYWKEDRAASCVPQSETTAGEIAERWIGLFANLPNGSRILDVATGNGVLLAHAAMAAERGGKRYSLTGVDLADIDPVRYVSSLSDRLRTANFMGGVAAESLPFADDAFDVVVSQYGLEYADLDKALGEIERVLVTGGQLIWLAHTEDSSVFEQNRDQSRQVAFLLAQNSPMNAMRRFVSTIQKKKNLERPSEKLKSSLANAEQFCRDHPPANIVREVCTTLAETAQRWQAFHADDLDKMLQDSRKRLIAHRQRINDLLAAVITPAREELVRSRLQGPQWRDNSMSTMRIGSDESPIGLLIEARRAD